MATIFEPVFALLNGKRRRKSGKKEEKDDPQAKDWLDKIKRAQEVKDAWKKQFQVDKALEYWEGSNRPAYYAADEWISINLIYSILRSTLPSLYSTDPYFYVKLARSYNPDPTQIALYEAQANVRQSMLNYLKRELNLKPKARLSIFDAFFQFGVCKVALGSEVWENPEAGKPLMSDDGTPLVGEDGQDLKEPDYLSANEAYEITRVHPDDFLVDEDAGPIEPDDVAWCAQRVKRRLSEVKEDKRYSASAREKLKATETSESERKRQEKKKGGGFGYSSQKATEADVVSLWEVYDLEEDKWLVVADGCDEFLMAPSDLPKGVDGSPFVALRYVTRPDSWYPLPPASQWLDQQREYGESRSSLLRHRKNVSNRKYLLYRQGFEDAEDAAGRLEAGEDGTVLIADVNPGYAPVSPIQDAPMDPTIHTELAYIRKDLEDVAIGATARGVSQGVESATEAGILEQRARMREGDERQLVAEFVQDVGRKLDQLVQAYITRDQAVRVSGPQGEYWAQVRAADYEQIEGEYEYTIDLDSQISQLPDVERAQWTAFLGLLANAPQLMLSKTLLTKMAEQHHIRDERMVEEIYAIGEAIMSGQLSSPNATGSTPGSGTPANAASPSMGTAAGANNMAGGMPNVMGG